MHPEWDMLPHGGFGEETDTLEEGNDFMEVGSDEYVMTRSDCGDSSELDIETELAEIELLLVETLLKYLVLKTLYLNYY